MQPETSAGKRPPDAVPNPMNKKSTYMVDGRRFVVTPVFLEDGGESFGSVLMRLMKAEVLHEV